MDSILAVMDGRLEDAMDMAERIRAIGEEAGIAGSAHVFAYLSQHIAQFYLGTLFLGPFLDTAYRRGLGLGQEKDTSVILEQRVVRRSRIGTVEDETIAWQDVLYLEEAVLSGHRKAAELLLNRLSGTSLCTGGVCHLTCVARQLGGAAALLGRYEEARNYYKEAIKVCTEMMFRPELALTHLQFAELLLEHYPDEKKEAIEHLDFAIKEFREMKMQPSLERALRHKEILKA
jgi:tetratricopeptide (TPR) repeat protein